MSGTNKRRRLNPSPSSTLTKPFKSPLRRPAPATESLDGAMQVQLQVQLQESSQLQLLQRQSQPRLQLHASKTRHQQQQQTQSSTSPSNSTNLTPTKSSTRPRPRPRTLSKPGIPKTPQKPTPLPVVSSPTTTELSSLTTQRAALLAHLHALTAEYDTLQQARRIETQKKTVELERLIQKWKGVSQRAAEEVFLGARERVNRMGGLQALKSGKSGAGSGSWGWDCEDPSTSLSAGLQGRGQSWEGDYEDAIGGEEDRAGKEGQDHDDDEEQELTMGVMLKMMKIEFGIIGYDVEREGWVT
ncbi:putative DNA repair protein Dds20/Mei5 [Aspergillus aculeatinus CBS 121060]|uniref:Uncharacterized protein n=1 Tax=Aspergillus aculeatinus CBS 121060 TaxID=1448322 RepID=A0ACD1H589_9EURO|nr:hypothetical protein BO66DRAFT_472594 [Aspergillus aculeatinus CBS 121060]RAH68670.1 hypothetical protein BO66DRAFT_472594 [Aspergillus aculeatinus CBS 121060]